ncbi:hypothetical protein HBI24_085690 [Parastagonospora nodorum]|uniref:Uncharacterized protein n=1 Tax=Phaeosphaeria nodorum (strain SN15 / ATCC MYA-4574 / FGSC 10173) TaxID=321614 RepID=A0A7U2I344_PHANO|nr:hypothetical protein HBH51_225570 [Parastagonospora nodorum]QRC97647.1 hypothetical protein JI435_410820 [Parastagonospora nodorum SN15]KAH4114813.1 hypothetical protein HBH47_189450 [Parastagonospora nodorum]KAH4291174.1 hypothetical protein HBI01_193030 [Parastagonospora nodorum]KAH4307886.1 hypothetical protein HBI02_109600 [Parastagonospora nodorum]
MLSKSFNGMRSTIRVHVVGYAGRCDKSRIMASAGKERRRLHVGHAQKVKNIARIEGTKT